MRARPFQAAPYNYPVLPTLPANTLIENLLPAVGASLPYRDYADYYVVNEVKSFGKKGELIANENTLPFSTLAAGIYGQVQQGRIQTAMGCRTVGKQLMAPTFPQMMQ